jgi:hypothetical protein
MDRHLVAARPLDHLGEFGGRARRAPPARAERLDLRRADAVDQLSRGGQVTA